MIKNLLDEKLYTRSTNKDTCIWTEGAIYGPENLFDLYHDWGRWFTQKIDGDFSLILKNERILIISTDVFGTRPIWIAKDNDKILAYASYASALKKYNFDDIRKVSPNTVYFCHLQSGEIYDKIMLHKFDLDQHVNTYDRWIEKFTDAVRKRVPKDKKLFMGLSSGYDTGAIACELDNLNIPFRGYAIRANENLEILTKRCALHSDCQVYQINESEYREIKNYIQQNGEDYAGKMGRTVFKKILPDDPGYTTFTYYNYKQDKASVGNTFMFRLAAKDGYSVALSGQGADEIISNYGFRGIRRYSISQIGGLFPENLASIFPYGNFFNGTQDCYLTLAAYIGRLCGIETRYPFLDTDLVQEFLWLKPELKNANYKAPIFEYLQRNGYPLEEGIKRGFRANCNLKQDRKEGELCRPTEYTSTMTCGAGIKTSGMSLSAAVQ